MPRLLNAAFGGAEGRRAALAMFDLSGKTTYRSLPYAFPKRIESSQSDDWQKIGRDFDVVIEDVDVIQDLNRAAK